MCPPAGRPLGTSRADIAFQLHGLAPASVRIFEAQTGLLPLVFRSRSGRAGDIGQIVPGRARNDSVRAHDAVTHLGEQQTVFRALVADLAIQQDGIGGLPVGGGIPPESHLKQRHIYSHAVTADPPSRIVRRAPDAPPQSITSAAGACPGSGRAVFPVAPAGMPSTSAPVSRS